ncbi:carboxymuconolactone decarboxylase family protein [Novosphingobium sp. LASN5T]|uniref:carboxymuconolactone decarboxylase family protein n=1 Tax=Novosphingobium sp. LASN5T TaxID=2491021 RepID=UPI000F5DFF5B|nr:carboxymuconolactone decarboxylase family protein [Novosphingobium sp. LASN5T]RQW40038.1 carboxymuconolactone decarboxylase family protein [Novosphingobium sp. LASN5T]
MTDISIAALREEAEVLTAGLAEGEPLDALGCALVTLAVAASVTALDRAATASAIAECFDAGGSIGQIQEILALASGLGVHTLMVTATAVLEAASARGLIDAAAPLDAERQALWDRHVGADPFWNGFSAELPGFLEAMLRLSPDIFTGFFEYCAIPWRSGTVRARVKELAALACDAAPSHRFRPGFRVHLKNAIALGIGRRAIMQAMDIAAAAPEHRGTD